jgi:hypothetical protein
LGKKAKKFFLCGNQFITSCEVKKAKALRRRSNKTQTKNKECNAPQTKCEATIARRAQLSVCVYVKLMVVVVVSSRNKLHSTLTPSLDFSLYFSVTSQLYVVRAS